MKFASVCVGLLCAAALCRSAEGSRLVVDDFSISQVEERFLPFGYSNDLIDPDLTFGSRQMTAGSDSTDTPMETRILDGLLHVNPNGTGDGTGGAFWPSIRGITASFPTFDLSAYHRLSFDVVDVIGEVSIRISFVSFIGAIDSEPEQLVVFEPGRYWIDIPPAVNREAIYAIAFNSRVDLGEELVIDNVWLVVPEPSSLGLFLGLALSACLFRGAPGVRPCFLLLGCASRRSS